MNSRYLISIRLSAAAVIVALSVMLWLAGQGTRPPNQSATGKLAAKSVPESPRTEPDTTAASTNVVSSPGPLMALATTTPTKSTNTLAAPTAVWTLRDDPDPRSHRYNAAQPSRRKPVRSASVRIAANWLADARDGDAATFDLGSGLIATGVFKWANRDAQAGVRTFAGTLAQPDGAFHLEHHPARGWGGSFLLKRSDEIVQLVPDRNEPGLTRLEVWPRRETVCASADDDGDPATAPVADPSIDHTQLQSRPGAPHVIYLDFDGETVSDTQWNVFYNSFSDIVAAPSGLNRNEIIAAWARAAEDWAPFNVNVTTKRSVYNATGQESRCMVVCTPTRSWYGKVGGVATLDSFNNVFVSAICWCWNVDNYIECAETISHEAAHTMGNSHASWESDGGLYDMEYYDGHETDCGVYWAPIMGNSFGKVGTEGLTQFTIDDTYPGSTVGEDQLDEIAYELGLLDDDHFDSIGGIPVLGTPLTLQSSAVKKKGLITDAADVDAFWIELPAGGWRIEASPNPQGPNVDVWLELQRVQGPAFFQLLRRSGNYGSTSGDGARGSLSASVDAVLDAGTYRIRVGSDHCNGAYGYPSYGGVGTYTLTIKHSPGFENAAPALSGISISGLEVGSKQVTAQINFRDDSKFDEFFRNLSIFLGTSEVILERVSGGVSIPGHQTDAAKFSTDDSGSAPVYRARQTFQFSAPGGWWDSAEAGDYRIRIVAGAVSDVWGNENAQIIRSVGALLPDTAAPTLEGTAQPSIVVSGSSEVPVVHVVITDQSPLLVTGNGASAFEAISASGGPSLPLTRLNYGKTEGDRKMFLLLAATPPAGGWDIDDTSVYHVVPKAGMVRDAEGNIAPSATIATFTISTRLWRQDFDDATSGDGFHLDQGWEAGFVNGTGGRFDDPTPTSGNDTRLLGYALGTHSQYEDSLNERAAVTPAIDTQGYERLTLRYRRWLTLRSGDFARIEVNNATTNDAWTTIWNSPPDGDFTQRGWMIHEVPLPSFVANSALHVRWIMGTTDRSGTAGGWNIDDVEILAAGTYQPARLVFNPLRTLATAVEGGANVSYTIRLNQQPAQIVSVTLTPDAQSDLVDRQFFFTPSTWNIPQTVTVEAINDGLVEGPHRTIIHHYCGGFDPTFKGVTVDRVVGLTDNDTPLIVGQPEDAILLPGRSIVLSVVPARVSGLTYQWFSGPRGDTRKPVPGATNPTVSVTLSASANDPARYWVRVNAPGRPLREEHSRQVTLSPLTGFAAFKQRLLQRGYTQTQINAPGFADADPDGNGLSHFSEHAVGIFPGQAPAGIRKVELAPPGAGGAGVSDLLVTLPPLQPDVVYILQASSQLTGWVTMAEYTGDLVSDPAKVVRIPHVGAQQLMVKLVVAPLQQ